VTRSASAGRLRHRVGEAIAEHSLWGPGDRVAVAVSGGLDSVACLDLLLETRAWHEGLLSVVTVDHGTRPESAGDAAFVRALAEQRGLACVCAEVDIPTASEDALRQARYRVFETVEADIICLGHHRDDQAETVLLQLLRGAGSKGLGGMRWKRGRYVRPLLATPRSEIAQWARHRNLEWREDATNADPKYLRNRVRSEVLPLLERLRPGSSAALARSAANLAADDACLRSLGEREPPWPLMWIREAPAALVRRSLASVLGTTARVDAALKIAGRGSGSVNLGREGRLEVQGDALVLSTVESLSEG
jgi:tRNA(Ile)-lysidine synthase